MTLVELLVAVALAGLVLVGVFVILTTSSRTFRLQTDMSQTMDRVNYAMDSVKADLRRAAYLTVPNTAVPAYPNLMIPCGNPAFRPNGLKAIQVINGGATWQPPENARVVPGQVPDQLLLLGAYRTADIFITEQASAGSNVITISTGDLSLPQLEQMFAGSVLLLRNRKGGVQLLRVATMNAVQLAGGVTGRARITLAGGDTVQGSAGPGTDQCLFTGVANAGMDVVPLHFVRYNVVEDPELRSAALLREELAWDNTVLSSFVVTRNLADFQVWFDRTNSLVGQLPVYEFDGTAPGSILNDTDGTMPWPDLADTAISRPEQTRYGYIQISVRLDTPVPGLPFEETGIDLRETAPIRLPQGGVMTDTEERTRILTMRSEVELVNFSLADI
jgi:type II secretory pathway pseudopilin PulG